MSSSIALITAEFNELITHKLLDGAKRGLLQSNISAERILEFKVPGAFELPLACQWLLERPDICGAIAIGAVIRGSTDHYTYVCNGCTNGLMQVQLKVQKPIAFCVLTCDSLEQALERVGGKLGNKGIEAGHSLLAMLNMKKNI